MKFFLCIIWSIGIIGETSAQGVTRHGKSSSMSTSFVTSIGKMNQNQLLNSNGKIWYCGSGLTIKQEQGGYAPVNYTITYGTVAISTGEYQITKCWTTRNLGATNQAISVEDTSEAARGWYFQFNRPQGYMHDGTTRTPDYTWVDVGPDQESDWLSVNDPCTRELGPDWRIPTQSEWEEVSSSWDNTFDAFNSPLRIHIAGLLDDKGGKYMADETDFPLSAYASSTQSGTGSAWQLGINPFKLVSKDSKAFGTTVRCVNENPSIIQH
jgi:hypothetical protein